MTRVGIQAWGAGEEALVLFHGWGFDSQIWLSFIPVLQRVAGVSHIIAVDLPGFGLTPTLEWDVFKSELLQDLPAKISLLGWSLGGLFATRLAIEAPDRIKKLINIATSPYFLREGAWPGVVPERLDDFYDQFRTAPEQTRTQFVLSQMGRLDSKLLGTEDKGLCQGLEILQQWDLRQALITLKVPTTYIFGRLDTIVPPRLRLVMQNLYPNFNYHVLGHAAHIPFLSHPEELLAVLPLE